jgi:phosphoglucosamine mutase
VLEKSLSSGLVSQGVDVTLIDVIPTPGLAYLTRTAGFDAGVMLSASHNPAEYNGIKFLSCDGFKLSDQKELEIEKLMKEYEGTKFADRSPGSVIREPGLGRKYLEYLRQIETNSQLDLRVVLDLANGATYSLGPALIKSLGADVTSIFDKPNGVNINANCGSTHLENLQSTVSSEHADVGFAFDGDGDRVLAVDEKGDIVDGDQILLISALDLVQQGKLHNNLVVATVMSNFGLEEALRHHNIGLKRTQVGDRYVVEEMLRCGAVLGGEQSGHIIFLDYNTTGDGMVTAVKILSKLKRSRRKVSELAAEMKRYPQIQLNVKVTTAKGWEQNVVIQQAISDAEHAISDKGRIIVRTSGTEPVIRIMVEGKDAYVIRRLSERIADVVRSEIGLQ